MAFPIIAHCGAQGCAPQCSFELVAWHGNRAELLHHAGRVQVDPVVGELTLRDAKDARRRHLHFLAGGRHAHERAAVDSAETEAARNLAALAHGVFEMNIHGREGGSEQAHELPRAFAALHRRQRGVVVDLIRRNDIFDAS
jgi:hypothetical protein